jgi:hypothetical protein
MPLLAARVYHLRVTQEHAAFVEAYWSHHRLAQGDRQSRLASNDYWWAVDEVQERVNEGAKELLPLLDALLDSPDADAQYFAAGPIEDMLHRDPARWDAPLAERCRKSARWREVLTGVIVGEYEERSLSELLPYLRRG